ncbi:MAG: 50S ribosomal protein L25 [Acidobacteriota bacterium]
MSQQFIEIEVEQRPEVRKKGRQWTASKGLIPGIVYGGGKEPVPIAVDPRKIIQILRSEKGRNTILLFSLKGTKAQRHVMVKEIQINPVTNELIHADFTRIMMDQKVKVRVPVVCEGTAYGVKTEGGLLDVIMREVQVECLPADIPDRVTIDLTPLKVGDSIKVSQLTFKEGVRVIENDLNQPVVVIAAPRIEAAPAAGEEAAPESQEPEVIGKGKKSEAEEEKEGK